MRCRQCDALWTEELVSRMGFDGDADREWEEYGRITEAEAPRRFRRAP